MAVAPERMGIGIRRHLTTEGIHPYDEVSWERRDARITNFADGSVAFEQLGVEVPSTWSVNATNILAQKYFRGPLGSPQREWSLKQVADRVADTITAWGLKDGYFVDQAEADAFNAELKHLVVHQRAAFNSPVWFNIGVEGRSAQASACQPYHAPVSTPEGFVPIGRMVEDDAVGAKVFDAHGTTRVVAVKANGRKPVLRIHTKAGYILDVTPDHLVWRLRKGGPGRFVAAAELRPGDKLQWHRRARSDPDAFMATFGSPASRTEEIEYPQVDRVEDLGEMDVYDIQTESGEYLSGNLRVHNCFILSVGDSMQDILNWYVEEGIIFKGGSGSGVNLSRIRSSKEPLTGGGTASGPVSFMRGADASAGTIKSGGVTRRAAKMVILDADHPDVEDFVWCKAIEERKARALRDAGFDMDLDGKDSHSIQYQNANNSVRVTDEFMQAVVDDADWHLRAVTTGEVVQTVKARDLMRQISQAAWECADPGMQFDTTINRWNTAANTGRINASNPCCFVGDTLVATAGGYVQFEMLHKMATAGQDLPHAVSYDKQRARWVLRQINGVWIAGRTNHLAEVRTEQGMSLRCTPEHRFLTTRGWVEARRLRPGMRLHGTGTDRVVQVRLFDTGQKVAVYDLEIEGTHNFAVTSDGSGQVEPVVVHNSEYMHLDNSACNLASLNLLSFLGDDGRFDVEGFKAAVEVLFTAQEILVGNADYPTEAITETSRRFRQLGIGYANLGALLMAQGLAYDSDEGRALAGAITALMTGQAYATSARTAARMGPFAGYHTNAEHMNLVLRMHRDEVATIDEELVPTDLLSAAQEAWDTAVELGELHGVRNSQASVLAPTGTIALLMDCDTTGIEPDLGLVKMKKLVGGGTMSIVNHTVPRALRRLGYSDAQVDDIVTYIDANKTILGAPHLTADHLPVFACSMGDNPIHYLGHVRMMAAVQPWVSGAISKCCAGDTLLPTADGLVRMASLHGGEAPDTFRDERLEVASLGGTQKTDAYYYGGTRPVREVALRSGHRVVATPNHRLLVAGRAGLEWRRLDEIESGDFVAIQYGAELWSPLPEHLDDFRPSKRYGCEKTVQVPREMSEDLALLLGMFAAEGHISGSNWSVVITNGADAVLEKAVELWRSLFAVEARIVRPADRCAAVVVASKTIVEFLDYLGCGRRASTKRIPDPVLRSPREMVLAFLQGLALDARCTVSPMGKWAICLDSPALLDDLQAVLTNLGVLHGRISKRNRGNGKSYGEVYATGDHAQRLLLEVPFLEPDKAARAGHLARRVFPSNHDTADVVPGISPSEVFELLPESGARAQFAFLRDRRTRRVTRRSLERVAALPGVVLPGWLQTVIDDSLHFSPVESVGDAGRRDVYDLSVPATHAFVGNGIVNHNTVNMPEDATVEDVEQLHIDAWRMGLKAVAIYRDNCKVAQPLSAVKKDEPKSEAQAHDQELAEKVAELEKALERQTVVVKQPIRERLPRRRRSATFAFRVADCEGYVTVGEYDDGRPGEVFIKVSKQGSTLAGVMDAFSISVSLGLQHGVPLKTYVQKYTNMRFEPAGMTDDADLRIASSLMDYIFRRLAVDYLSAEERAELGILTTDERIQPTLPGVEEVVTPSPGVVDAPPADAPSETQALVPVKDAPFCYSCGIEMQPAGSCFVCGSCGATSGCS